MAGGAAFEFVEGWLVAQVLGEGAYGEVRLLVHARTGESVALKTMRAGGGGGEGGGDGGAAAAAAREAALHRALRHPHVLRCLGERKHLDLHYMFLEYAQGGELFDRIEPDVGMRERDARRYWRQLLAGVHYLHERGVAHRDIKPENLLLDAQDNIKISDFGMATLYRHAGMERLVSRRCGTLPYAAPEVLTAAEQPYRAPPADLWACGVVLLAMLAGELPWERADGSAHTYAAWAAGRARGRPWDKVSARALTLLRCALAVEPARRAALPALRRHVWTAEDTDQTDAKRPDVERAWCSQPPASGAGAAAEEASLSAGDMDAILSYSQPAAPDDLLLATQHTHHHQSVVQRLVRRMTRVWVRVSEGDALAAVAEAARARGHVCRRVHPRVLALTCARGLGLRVWAVSAGAGRGEARVLLEFRRSRGCGIEFKRAFLELRDALQHVAAPAPHDARVDLFAPPIDHDHQPHQPMDMDIDSATVTAPTE